MTKTKTNKTLRTALSPEEAAEKKRRERRKEDTELIGLALSGDQRAFRKLRAKYYEQVHILVSRLVHSKAEVDDLTQEAFIKAFTSLQFFNNEFAFSTWLCKIASNNAIDYLRKKKLQTFSIHAPIESDEDDYMFEVPDAEPIADQSMIAEQRKQLLDEAMGSLPPKYRQVILMRHVDEKEYVEIAKVLKLPLGTVKAHIFRARELLYKQLKDKMRHY
jgi:RNA polymerase sigma-70 factor (ECF subfamily)